MNKELGIRNKEGFTLVEMMVVIAVIGILAAAVLGGLLPARTKARDSRIISAVQQARAIIESAFDPTTGQYPALGPTLGGTYATQYGADNTAGLRKEVKDNSPADGVLKYTTDAGRTGYTLSAKLNSDQFYCVDGAGLVKQNAATPGDTAIGC